MDSRNRHGRVVAAVVWVLVLGTFFYLLVVGAPGPMWLAYVLGTLIGVAIVGYLRLRGVKASTVSHKPYMIMLSVLVPQVDRLLREAERRDSIVEENAAIIEMMGQTLTKNGFDSSVSVGLSRRYVDRAGFGVERLSVLKFASDVAAEMSATDLETLLDSPTDDVAHVLALLYWDAFDCDSAQMSSLWMARCDELAEPLAAVLVSRLPPESTVDEGELATFLRSLPRYGFTAVELYVSDRPVGVVARMMDVLESYAPTGTSTAPGGNWPKTTALDLGKAVAGQVGEAAQITAAASHCAGLVAPAAPSTAELLEFLYLRRWDRSRAIGMWTTKSTTLPVGLAAVLSAGPQLARRDPVYARNVDCLTEIIRGLVEYSLASVQRIVVELRRHYDCAEQMLEFVDRRHGVTIDPLELQHCVASASRTGMPTREDLIVELSDTAVSAAVVTWAARQAIAHPTMTKRQVDTAALVVAGEFSMRSDHCPPNVACTFALEASRLKADPMILAVLVERKYRDPFPHLGVVLRDLSSRTLTFDPALLQLIHDRLEVGEWPTALPKPESPPPLPDGSADVVAAELATLSTELTELRRLVGDMPTDKALARLRPHLAGGVALPRNEFDRMYLVMFDSKHGPVGALLDTLSSMTDRLNERLREMVEPTATDCLEDVCRRVDHRYYTFGHYTRYTRLGVLPPSETFDDFAANFFDDVHCLLRLTNARRDFRRPASGPTLEWEDVEVNLLCLGEPIRYDLYRVGEPGLREHSPLESEELTRHVGEQALKPMIVHRSPPQSVR